MSVKTTPSGGAQALEEIQEFAALSSASQRYIRRSLDVAFERQDAVTVWSRNPQEAAAIARQRKSYALLRILRESLSRSLDLAASPCLFGPMVWVSARDLAEGKLHGFPAYRFLYERLFGSAVRPWLASSYLAAATMPSIAPALRRSLLQTMPEEPILATIWPAVEPQFFPEWIDKA